MTRTKMFLFARTCRHSIETLRACLILAALCSLASNATASIIVGSLDTPGPAVGIEVVGGLAYVANADAGLRIIDVSNPAAPIELGAFPRSFLSCNTIQPENSASVYDVAVVGGVAYLAAASADGALGFDSCVFVVDVSNPMAPVLLSRFGAPGRALDVEVVSGVAYVPGILTLRITDVSNPAAPGFLGSIDTSHAAVDVEIVGELAYVADGRRALRIIDVSNPAAPIELGAIPPSDYALDVEVVGTMAYLADNFSGLSVIDVSNPAVPVYVGGLDTPGKAEDVEVVGELAYVADGSSGLRIIDVSNPAAPIELDSLDTPGEALDVEVVGGLAYVADGISGLLIIAVPEPSAETLGLAALLVSALIARTRNRGHRYRRSRSPSGQAEKE